MSKARSFRDANFRDEIQCGSLIRRRPMIGVWRSRGVEASQPQASAGIQYLTVPYSVVT